MEAFMMEHEVYVKVNDVVDGITSRYHDRGKMLDFATELLKIDIGRISEVKPVSTKENKTT